MKRKTFAQHVGLWLLVGLFLVLCSTGVMAANSQSPQILKFTADQTVVKSGQTVTLSWQTANATEVKIFGIDKEAEAKLPVQGTMEVWPMVSTSYVLIAYGADGTAVSKSVSVNVGVSGTVAVESFTASPMQVLASQTVTLSWKVSNGQKVRILGISPKGDESVCPVVGTREVWPQTTTTYLLEATGVKGEITSAAVTVNVNTAPPVKQPKILTFTTSDTVISKGELVILSWTTENATKCTIMTSDGGQLPNRPVNGSIGVTPNKTKTFTLVASNASGDEVRQSLVITVK